MLQSCVGFFLFPACDMLPALPHGPSFSCHVGMLLSEICDISTLMTPQRFCRVFPSAIKFLTFNLHFLVAFFYNQSVFLLHFFSKQTHIKSRLSFHTWKVVSTGRWSSGHYFSLSYIANTIKCFLIAITTIITVKCNLILCITGHLSM